MKILSHLIAAAAIFSAIPAQAQQQFAVTFTNQTPSNVTIRTTYIGQSQPTELGVVQPGNSVPIQTWSGQIFEYFTNNRKIGGYQVKNGLGQQVAITAPSNNQPVPVPPIATPGGGGFLPQAQPGQFTPPVAVAVPAAANQPINFSTADMGVINQAILAATNQERAKNGLPPFQMSPQLVQAAQMHADDMVNQNFFSHTNPTNAQHKFLAQRVALTGFGNARSSAENIGEGFGVQYKPNSQLQFGGPGVFLDLNGRQIPTQTPTTLAAALLAQWMGSAGHRANILSANTHFGCGLQAYKDPTFNDMIKVKAVQVFASQ